MALSEADLELLDSYLDDELPPEQAEALRKRLSTETELTEAMDQVRFERDARMQFFSALEPDKGAVDRLVDGICRKVDRELLWTRRARALRSVSSIAACLLVGFFGGYVFRGTPTATQNAGFSPSQPQSVANGVSANREIVFPDNNNRIPAVPTMPRNGANAPGSSQLVGYEVKLTDDAGNVVGVQRFPTYEQARDFLNDVTRTRGREHNQLGNGGVRLIGEQF